MRISWSGRETGMGCVVSSGHTERRRRRMTPPVNTVYICGRWNRFVRSTPLQRTFKGEDRRELCQATIFRLLFTIVTIVRNWLLYFWWLFIFLCMRNIFTITMWWLSRKEILISFNIFALSVRSSGYWMYFCDPMNFLQDESNRKSNRDG